MDGWIDTGRRVETVSNSCLTTSAFSLCISRALFICALSLCVRQSFRHPSIVRISPHTHTPLNRNLWDESCSEAIQPDLWASFRVMALSAIELSVIRSTSDPASTCISTVHSAFSLHNVCGVFSIASCSQRAILHVAMLFV